MKNHRFSLPPWQEPDVCFIVPNYPDIERLVEITARYRETARAAVADYRAWLEELTTNREVMGRCYALYEGQYLRARICDSWRFYRIVRAELTRLQRHYRTQIMLVRA